ncbi:MAG: beta-ketoacyl synthase chain length factor [Myxococcales bacterium]|jgi:hypothetical protein
MKAVYAGGVGLWTAGYAGPEAWIARAPDAAVTAPASALLPAALKRRSSLLTRMAVEALAQAAASGGADLATVPTVWGSAYGEIETTIAMLEMMREPDGLPSPTRFHNSVHNTASGTASIAGKNRSMSTSIAAGRETVAMGLVEAAALLAERGGDAVLVLFDEPPPAPFAPEPAWPALAVAFHLSAEPRPTSRVALAGLRRRSADAPAIPSPYASHPCAPALGLLEAIAKREEKSVPLSHEAGGGWVVEARPVREP